MDNHRFVTLNETYIEFLEKDLENNGRRKFESREMYRKDIALLLSQIKRLEHLLERLADQYLTEKWELIDEVHQLKAITAKLQANGTTTRRIIKSKSIDNRHEYYQRTATKHHTGNAR